MKHSDKNKCKAEQLLDEQPVGRTRLDVFAPWIVKALCFLLHRYIRED